MPVRRVSDEDFADFGRMRIGYGIDPDKTISPRSISFLCRVPVRSRCFGTAAAEVDPYSRRKIASLVLHIRSGNFSQPPGVEALDSQFNPTYIWPYWFCLILLSFIFCWRGCSGPNVNLDFLILRFLERGAL